MTELLDKEGVMKESTEVSLKQEEILKNLADAELTLDIVLVEKQYEIGELMMLTTGSMMMFDTPADDSAWLTINGKRFAYGEIVRKNEFYGLRITGLAKH